MEKPDMGNKFAVTFGDELGKSTEPIEGVGKALEYVYRKGYNLFCASNGIKTMQINRLQEAGLLNYFCDIYVSDEIGYEKPAKQFFDYCLAASGYSPTDVLMIGDSVSADIQGALAAGWQACYLNRNGTAKPFGCIEIRNLNELLNLL